MEIITDENQAAKAATNQAAKAATNQAAKAATNQAATTTKTRRYFAGANTKHGFFNLFGQINSASEPSFLYILKGGPGTGKSTLMKKIGSFFEGKTDVEYFYCSSDHQSLDGVRLPAVNIAVVDGTAPHVAETTIPAAKERLVDLGAFIGGDRIKQNQREIATLIAQKQLFFKQAYLYIKNASNLYDCNNLIFSSLYKDADAVAEKIVKKILRRCGLTRSAVKEIAAAENLSVENTEAENPPTKITAAKNTAARITAKNTAAENTAAENTAAENTAAKNPPKKKGEIRKLFLSAIAGGDFVDFAPYNNYSSVINLEYDGYLCGLVLNKLADVLPRRGVDSVCFLQPLSPQEICGVFIPAADVLITGGQETVAATTDKRLSDAVLDNNAALKDALFAAGKALSAAKDAHKKIEEFYIPAMDFASVGSVTLGIIKEIEKSLCKS